MPRSKGVIHWKYKARVERPCSGCGKPTKGRSVYWKPYSLPQYQPLCLECLSVGRFPRTSN